MKNVLVALITLLIIISLSNTSAYPQTELNQGDEVYVKVNTENFRLSPNGSIITQLPQGTKLTVLGEQNNWVAVQIVGWIYKPSLAKSKTEIVGLTMRALHIMVRTEEEAKDILTLLKSGNADFSTVAKERSIGPNAQRGGDLGKINKGDLLPVLDDAIRKLQPNEVSNVIKSELGYHIFKRIE
ncbi:peptidylprolyl isomerase [candidate division KSB1 bacterium]|nr:peptidylprolyl isomerase [candidate division KSB1 bacterium]